ncbi:NADH-cytochrome b5 reductase [Puccinia graminis f. sp. tritici]|uniref:NADH-cytochrome b5 reductase n=1 Tax=Puccinia graminis f. sp. tritici TaxID=56615 RepID=A0A5B0NW99_PUCGR|nr:NADH-cytochrome b5 reductase [Puccinia graminis f. sp. tritici]KAA1093223.1 NADH-cytochrome b5 reductase [Puccinia graminis f. sp. tritici]KAA1127981.1 NADH-cytochrome b5 reductase [Puccinia graminis f. sp. tritici]
MVSQLIQSNQSMLTILAILLAALLTIRFIRSSTKPKPALVSNQFQHFKLHSKKEVSPNTAIYRFALASQDDYLGLPIGQHIVIQAEIGGKQIQRMYTPVSSDDDRGYFELMIKTYEQGNISKYISKLRIGDPIQVKGPRGQMRYHPELCSQIGMIAGGTGITPMLQIIRASVKDSNDKTKISLIYANVNPEDILLKQELDRIQNDHPKRFSVYYVLNNPPEGWTGGAGFVTKEMIESKLPPSKLAKQVKILLCGPPPMMSIMKKYLEELEFEKCRVISKLDDQVFCF